MIALRNLQKIVNQSTVLDIETLVAPDGEITALVGPPGSGKEILFDLLIGRLMPTAGSIELAGINPTNREAFSRSVGVLFLDDALYKYITPLENLTLHTQFHGLPKERALRVLELLGMADQANTDAVELRELLHY